MKLRPKNHLQEESTKVPTIHKKALPKLAINQYNLQKFNE
jgi:hypothetical protein